MALTTPMFSSLIGSRTILLSIIVCFAFTTSSAQTLRFSTPVAGTLGKDVFLVNHVDHDTTQGEFRNYNCKPYTYDGHDGTDFVLKSFRHMDSGPPPSPRAYSQDSPCGLAIGFGAGYQQRD